MFVTSCKRSFAKKTLGPPNQPFKLQDSLIAFYVEATSSNEFLPEAPCGANRSLQTSDPRSAERVAKRSWFAVIVFLVPLK
jgi:hypothetical protein